MTEVKNLIFSKNKHAQSGPCLTIYIPRGSIFATTTSLKESLEEARAFLDVVLDPSEFDKFFQPLMDLANDVKMLNMISGNIAIFRSRGFFRVTSIPVSVQQMTVVADTFHIKPLLKWAQTNKDLAWLIVEGSILEFEEASELGLARKNLFQIAAAAVEGRVKKLIVAEETVIWGRLDRRTGGVLLHPVQMDHQDDDILDDLAEIVLSHGGEVVIAPADSMPKGRPVVAILNPKVKSARKRTWPMTKLLGA
jgi:hypothetical protein